MLLVHEEELAAQGINCQAVTELKLFSQWFRKDTSFPPEQRQRAIDLCRQQLDAGTACLLIDHGNCLTLWQAVDQPQAASPKAELATPEAAIATPDGETEQRRPTYKSLISKLNEPVDLKKLIAKLNEPIF